MPTTASSSASASASASVSSVSLAPARAPWLRVLAVAALLPLGGLGCLPEGSAEATATESTSSGGDQGESESEGEESSTSEASTGVVLLCEPGFAACSEDGQALEVCAEDGLSYGVEPCGDEEQCIAGSCLGPCDLIDGEPSSAGCSFTTQASAHSDAADGLLVTNISDLPASVQLWRTPKGTLDEEAVGAPVLLSAGEGHVFAIEGAAMETYSAYTTGGSFRVSSDRPVVVHQSAPLEGVGGGDSGLLVPDHALGLEYVVASYPSVQEPSYFTVVATENKTRLRWTPTADSAGSGLPIPFVAAGETGELIMLRGDTVRIGASALGQTDPLLRDLSGTLVWADKPIAVVGASHCAQVPADASLCDQLYEPLLPVQTWGEHYIGAPAPTWQTGGGVWRVYAGADGVTVDVETEAPTPALVLAKRGDWVELDVAGAAASFTGDGPFLPVYYLASPGEDGEGLGAPSMVQAQPVAQYQTRYAFSTGGGLTEQIVQVIRPLGGAPVVVDGKPVEVFESSVGGFEIAEIAVDDGSHIATSAAEFGLVSVGFGEGRSYAQLPGVGLAVLQD